MPNTITLNSGTGGQLLTTDEIVEAGVTAHAQYVKILSGSAGASAAIGGTIADGLYVNVRNVSGAIRVSAAGTQLVSGIVTVGGTVLVSADGTQLVAGTVTVGGTVLVSADGTQLVAGKATVVADPQATFFVATSVDRNISVSAHGALSIPTTVANVVSVSAQGAVNWPVSGKVSGVGTFLVAGKVTVVADPQATFFVTTSADRGVGAYVHMGLGCASPASANGTPNAIKYTYINASAAGDLTLVAATATRSIRVIGYAFICPNSALPVFFQDTEATTIPKILAAFTVVTGGGVSYAGGIHAPAFQTTVGAGIELKRGVTSDAIVQGHMTWIEVTN